MKIKTSLSFVQIMLAAREEARRLKHSHLGVEHLFMALCRLGGVTEHLLRNQGIDPRKIRREIRHAIERRFETSQRPGLHYTPRLRSILKPLNAEAAEEMTAEISEIDLFNAIISEGESLPIRLLRDQGIKLDQGFTSAEAVQAALAADNIPERPAAVGEQSWNNEYKELLSFGRDLTDMARQGKLNEVIGRDDEVRHLEQVLLRATKSNPVLLGEAGVGKTAIIEKLAILIARNQVIKELQDVHIIEINMTLATAGTKFRGDLEENFVNIIKAAKNSKNIILAIDEIHTIVGSAGMDGGLNVSNILKPALGRGDIRLIGATTREEYRKYIENDAALERRFQPIVVSEPSPSETFEILAGIKEHFQHHHDVIIDESALHAAVELAVRFLPERKLPDKAIDLLDEACAYARIREIESGQTGSTRMPRTINASEIATVLTEWTGLPVSELSSEQRERLKLMPERLAERVIGQDEAIQVLTRSLETALTGLRYKNRPMAVLLFVGPTGVGKTELAKALAENLFGSAKEMIRLDMSEYQERHQVAKLIGAPPGYIGYAEAGMLTESLRKKPYSVVLLDEVEKAHPDVFDIFLQLFDDGRLTDAHGKTVDGTEAIFIMTSNLGSGLYEDDHSIGFTSRKSVVQNEEILRECKKFFKPEFINRIDEIIYFKPLSKTALKKIVMNITNELGKELAKKGIELTLSTELVDHIVKKGYEPMYGARPLRRTFEQLLVQPLAHMMVKGNFVSGDRLKGSLMDGEVILKKLDNA
ncbi:ATP-dependent Clp protease ATP-binding subunit [Sulfuriflexus mobilis]|uniref:ATP-dependent Clp protease ATP-binding subunit n=1 Tax=Sulfuriflexus mobilis TaxID=1811807 RepID=UPI000F83899D|nr:ATP-dependent Clp protease ATP-binding subunit [Sulfuriflexus mobilis]